MKVQLVFAGCLSFASAWRAETGTIGGEKVLLSNVQTLTLHEDRKTSGRRNNPLPQLECRGSNCRRGFQPPVVQCYNRGTDGIDVQWECKAEMPAGFSFGRTEVSCEGYGYPEDPYILRGSCSLGYELKYDASAAARGGTSQQQQQRYNSRTASAPPGSHTYGNSHKHWGWTTYGLMALIGWLLMQLCTSANRRRHGTPTTGTANPYATGSGYGGGGGGGYGGGGAGGGAAGFRGGGTGGTSWFGSAPPAPDDGTNCGTSGAAPRAGATNFWTGLAAGGLGGYLMNRRTGGGDNMRYRGANLQQQHSQYGSRREDSNSSPTVTRTQSTYASTSRR